LLQDYLSQENTILDEYFSTHDWQNYESIKSTYQNNNEMLGIPEWYNFHNLRTGNSKLLLLPDLRGERDNYYLKVWSENEKITNSELYGVKLPTEIDKRPFLFLHDKDVLAYIVTTFDTKEAQQGHRYFTESNKDDDESEYFERILKELLKAKEFVPIQSHHDFREALEKAYHVYRCKMISEHIPLAYEQYLLNRQMNFSVPKDDIGAYDLREKYANMILDGRELNGEPRDFDY